MSEGCYFEHLLHRNIIEYLGFSVFHFAFTVQYIVSKVSVFYCSYNTLHIKLLPTVYLRHVLQVCIIIINQVLDKGFLHASVDYLPNTKSIFYI